MFMTFTAPSYAGLAGAGAQLKQFAAHSRCAPAEIGHAGLPCWILRIQNRRKPFRPPPLPTTHSIVSPMASLRPLLAGRVPAPQAPLSCCGCEPTSTHLASCQNTLESAWHQSAAIEKGLSYSDLRRPFPQAISCSAERLSRLRPGLWGACRTPPRRSGWPSAAIRRSCV